MRRLAFDGGGNEHFTNAAPIGRPPTRYSAPELAKQLVKEVVEKSSLAAPALKALAALELNEEQLTAVAASANPTLVLRQSGASQDSASDDVQRDVYLGALRVLAAHRERAKPQGGLPDPVADKMSAVLKQEQAPGLTAAQESFRPRIQADWDTYRADAAQTLLAMRADIKPHLRLVVELWLKLNSPSHIRQSKPHERLISPCALGAAGPDDLAPVFAEQIRREENASTRTSSFLLVEALTGLACTGTSDKEHHRLIASVFNSHTDPDEPPSLGGKTFADANLPFWQAARPESVRSAAAAALLRLGVAGGQDMPSVKDALGGIDRRTGESIDESSLPAPQWLERLPADFIEGLRAAAAEALVGPDERLRVLGARVVADLWLAGKGNEEVATRLVESPGAGDDAETLRTLLLIAHTNSVPHSLKEKVKGLFKNLLEQDQGAKSRNAVVALGRLHVKDELPRIRSGVTTYIPVQMDEGFAKELAPALRSYESVSAKAAKGDQQEARRRRSELLEALGYVRAEAATQLLDIIASDELRASQMHEEAFDAVAKSGPLRLQGVCQLLELSTWKGASAEVSARAAAYYVSDGSAPARLLISTLWEPPTAGGQRREADEVEARLQAILTALSECKMSPDLREALGRKSVELAKTPEGKRNEPLLRDLVAKYEDTTFAGEIMKAAGLQKPEPSIWYYVLIRLLLAAVVAAAAYAAWLLAFAKKPLRRLELYEKVPEIKIPIPFYGSIELPLRPTARLVLRPFRKRVLDRWVESYADEARKQYLHFCQKADAWPRAVKVDGEPLVRLEPRNLQQIFSSNQVLTLVTGGSGTLRYKLACLLGWWAMAGQAGERLRREHLMLPVIIRNADELLDHKDIDAFLQEVTVRLRALIMIEDTIQPELLRQLLKQRRVLVIIDGLTGRRRKAIGSLVTRLNQYPVNAYVITLLTDEVLEPRPKGTIHIC